MYEAILEELGLMPVWQLRPKLAAAHELLADAELMVINIQREDGVRGWVVMSEGLAEDAAVLFANMLQAMHLRQDETMQLAYAQLLEPANNGGVQWVWLLGESLAQRMLATESSVAVSSQPILQWQNLPVFVSTHPRELLLRPQEKAIVWARWCEWLQHS